MQLCDDKESRIDSLFLQAEEALKILKLRRQDQQLKAAVEHFLSDDIPDCMVNTTEPALYFPRHIATPSFETIHVMALANRLGMKLFIGQDTKGKFVTHNELKLPLGKLRFTVGQNKQGADITEYRTVVDFKNSVGRPLSEVSTIVGFSLPELHGELLKPWLREEIIVFDESAWIDKWARTDVIQQYKRMFAFACYHSIMVEWFTKSEFDFALDVMVPAFRFVENSIGVRPLMIAPVERHLDRERDWNAYPVEAFRTFQQLQNSTSLE